ncbi:MAG: hypothetical protein ABI467_30385 [Kofleriaceae bacterium]
MKRYRIAFVLATLTACGGGSKKADHPTAGAEEAASGIDAAKPEPPACSDEGAGHDFADAKPLAAGDFNGCTGLEPDLYSVLAPDHPPGTLYEVNLAATGADVVGTIFDQDQHELGTATVKKGSEEKMFVVLATNSRMFIKVVGDDAKVAPYAITTKASPLIDEDEPNDTAETARPLNLGTTRTALLQSAANNKAGSADFYRILLGQDGTLHVNVEAGTNEVNLAVAIFDRTGKHIADGTAPNAGAAVTIDKRVKRGEFVIEVSAADEAPTRPFSLGTAPQYLHDGYRITATKK